MNRLEGMEGSASVSGPWWEAMVEYLRDFEYDNVESDDLFGALEPVRMCYSRCACSFFMFFELG